METKENKQQEEKVRALCEVKYVGYSEDSLIDATGKMMVYLNGVSKDEISPGDLIISKSDYRKEKRNTNPEVFDYQKYLENRSIYHKIFCKENSFQIIRKSKVDIWDRAGRYQEQCLDIFKQHLSSGHNLAVVSAMVLGERNLLSDELYDAFTDTGAVHVLAVSGLHVGIVAGMVALLFHFISKHKISTRIVIAILSIICVWAFAILTGAAAAVTRAALMFSLYFIGRSFHRPSISFNVLSAAAFFMLIYHPAFLFQAGFQFSFLALGGIMFFYKRIRDVLKFRNRALMSLWKLIAMSLSAQVLVSPLAIYYFHKLPVYFWLTGIVAVPAAVVILYLGLFLILCHVVLGSGFLLTKWTALILDSVLSYFNSVIFNIQKLPLCSADDLWLSTTSLVLIYLALIISAIYVKFKKPVFLFTGVLILLIQILNHTIENNMYRKKKELVVYDIYSESMAHLYYKGQLLEFTPGITERKQIDYITTNNRLAHRIYAEPSAEVLDIKSKNGFYAIDDNLILFYPTKEALNYTAEKTLDLIVLSADSYLDIKALSQQFKINQIVADGTLMYKKDKLWQAASNANIPIHFTTDHGAYEYEL